MDCADFLENYSDFLDRRLEIYPLEAYRDHLTSCPSCTRYDRVLQSGLRLVRQIDPPGSDIESESGVQNTLYRLQDSLARQQAMLSRVTGVALMSAAALVLALGLPSLTAKESAVELPPLVIEVPPKELAGAQAPGSFFNLNTSIAPTTPILVPDFPEESWLEPGSEKLSLFRAPLRSSAIRPGPTASKSQPSAGE